MRTRPSNSPALANAAAQLAPRCSTSGSPTCTPRVREGFSEVIGSWKIIAMRLPRIACISASVAWHRSRPSKTTLPPVISPGGRGISRSIDSAVTDLPEPDSPTMASVSPAATSKDTSSTAVTQPASVRKRVVRLRTCNSISAIAASDPSAFSSPDRARCGRKPGRASPRRRAIPHRSFSPTATRRCSCRASAARYTAPCR